MVEQFLARRFCFGVAGMCKDTVQTALLLCKAELAGPG